MVDNREETMNSNKNKKSNCEAGVILFVFKCYLHFVVLAIKSCLGVSRSFNIFRQQFISDQK